VRAHSLEAGFRFPAYDEKKGCCKICNSPFFCTGKRNPASRECLRLKMCPRFSLRAVPAFLHQKTKPGNGVRDCVRMGDASSVVAPTSGKTFRMRVTRTALSPASEKYFPTGLGLLQSCKGFRLHTKRAVAKFCNSPLFLYARRRNLASRECPRPKMYPRCWVCALRTFCMPGNRKMFKTIWLVSLTGSKFH